jgi:hypothetical protein
VGLEARIGDEREHPRAFEDHLAYSCSAQQCIMPIFFAVKVQRVSGRRKERPGLLGKA